MDERESSPELPDPAPQGAVLVAHNNETDARLLARTVERSGFRAQTAVNGKEAQRLLTELPWTALIVDFEMKTPFGLPVYTLPVGTAPAVLAIVNPRDVSDVSPPLPDVIDDFLLKPQDFSFAAARLRRTLQRREQRAALERRTSDYSHRLSSKFQHFLNVLLQILEARDITTYRRCARVANLAGALCDWIRPGDREFRTQIRTAGLFHDIGVVGIRESILRKAGKLDSSEIEEMRQHPEIGETILRPLFLGSAVTAIVRHHHEQWDGNGYPDRLAGEDIPLGARIVAVADAYEAMTAARRYRPAMDPDHVMRILQERAGGQWDPDVVEALLNVSDRQSLQGIAAGEVHEIARSVMIDAGSYGFSPHGHRLGAGVGPNGTRRPVILLTGDLEPQKLPRLRTRIEGLLNGGEYDIILDMAGVHRVDDEIVRMLHVLHRQAQHHGGRIVLRDPSETALAAFVGVRRDLVLPFEYSPLSGARREYPAAVDGANLERQAA